MIKEDDSKRVDESDKWTTAIDRGGLTREGFGVSSICRYGTNPENVSEA